MATFSMSALGGKADIPASSISGLLMTQSGQQAPVAFALYFPQAMAPQEVSALGSYPHGEDLGRERQLSLL
jgi:hypothetical protein